MPSDLSWAEIVDIARDSVVKCGDIVYVNRLNFEIAEIEKQSSSSLWEGYYNSGKKFTKNQNCLVLPWVLGMMTGDGDFDPIAGRKMPLLNTIRASAVVDYRNENGGDIPFDFIKDADMPDIDLDCLPDARDPIKEYAIKKYGGDNSDGYGHVCSVGTWQTYKFKSAIIDVCSATNLVDKSVATSLTTSLPDEVDGIKDKGRAACKGMVVVQGTNDEKECGFKHAKTKCPKCGSSDTDGPTIGKILEEHKDLQAFAVKYPDIIKYAVRLVGKIRNMGMHAGALIIADRPLYGNVPMARGKKGYWISMWSEGRNAQLSKFGYNKWDILGLKTLQYIFNCCKLIQMNRGIFFGKPPYVYQLTLKNGSKIDVKSGEKIKIDGDIVDIDQLYLSKYR